METTLSTRKNHWTQYAIFLISLGGLLGSLYYQLYGDPVTNIMQGVLFPVDSGFIPCSLCRWARILLYPIVLLSFISLCKKDRKIADYILPLAGLGILLELYHYLLQKTTWVNRLSSGMCDINNPCNALQVDYLGVITIPLLAGIAFVAMFFLALRLKKVSK